MKKIVKMVVTFEPIMQFWCSFRFRILRTMLPSIKWRKTKKTWYFGRYWQSQLVWHTNRQTDRHGNSMTDPAQRAELVKLFFLLHLTKFKVCFGHVYQVQDTTKVIRTATQPLSIHIYIMKTRLGPKKKCILCPVWILLYTCCLIGGNWEF